MVHAFTFPLYTNCPISADTANTIAELGRQDTKVTTDLVRLLAGAREREREREGGGGDHAQSVPQLDGSGETSGGVSSQAAVLPASEGKGAGSENATASVLGALANQAAFTVHQDSVRDAGGLGDIQWALGSSSPVCTMRIISFLSDWSIENGTANSFLKLRALVRMHVISQ